MTPAHQSWIQANVPSNPVGLCWIYTNCMMQAFPELKQIRGHYYSLLDGHARGHWWLVTPDGQVVDPTAAQFPDLGAGDYQTWPEHAPEPMGKCMNCGKLCFEDRPTCSEVCGAGVMQVLKVPLTVDET